ncbi:hypothetical protein NP493_4074g00000 [Ridgeia piscesae]|uniref:Uncharacterized protein n=1 Tax=Ridgeia piscesae TaxID=27915 RepID=A0AAD9J2V1_RIDPI|nr:hypothetical protein NP493_5681g00001 [Ridgeia piscesae]KAK2140581.1 hypothetical protein NP493_5681g00000 [Ridgeia piscesae]KAK2140582.1 hypothetical protein NP493_5681g00002 [Ridgeia piscesae]KAK2144960.1 hypothetical protein NP493_4074g00000 [Ridgeia piscesae]
MQKRALYERWYMRGCSRLVHLFVRAWQHTSAVFYRNQRMQQYAVP